MKKKVFSLIFIFVIIILSMVYTIEREQIILGGNEANREEGIAKEENAIVKEEDTIIVEPEEEEIIPVKIAVAGDILYHGPQIVAGYDEAIDDYYFDDDYQYIKKYIDKADLALVTVETTFGGEKLGYTGYPRFNAPANVIDSLKKTGFDGINLANNHIMDYSSAFHHSINEIKSRGLDVLGVRENEEIEKYMIKEINGMKIGISSYTYDSGRIGNQRTINGIPIPLELTNNINCFGEQTLQTDLLDMKQTIEDMKADGAEYIIFLMHWGDEYHTMYSDTQKQIAEALNSYGVDIIFGSHPHVVQPMEKIINSTTQKETLVFYALGNFISNQREETMGNEKSEDGSIAQIELDRDEDGIIYLKSYEYIPTWVYKYTDKNNKLQYTVLPIEETLENYDSSTELLPQHIIDALKVSQTSTTEIIGQP